MEFIDTYMRDMSRQCQRVMSRYASGYDAGIFPHMTERLKDQILERIEERLRVLDITANAAGIASGQGKDLIRDWRRSKGLPRIDSLIRLAPVLKTTPQWLSYGTGENEITELHVPIVSWVAASAFADAPQIVDTSDHPTMLVSGLAAGPYIALEVKGDSMNRVAPEGTRIVVDLQARELLPRRFYVFLRGTEATFKRYMTSPDRLEPFSTNAAHEAIPANDDVSVVGRVVQAIQYL